MDRPSVLRQAALLVVVAGATLLMLLGARAVVQRVDDGPVPGVELTPGPGAPAPSSGGTDPSEGPPSPVPSDDPDAPVLVGAGDIAVCETEWDEATAALLDAIPGTIFTAGDNVYPRATSATFAECFEPSWGRHLDRIRPAAGNHDWESGSLDPFRDHFGERGVNEDGQPWYTFEVGTWQIIVLASDCDRVGGCGPDSEQGRWLAETLAAATDVRCRAAIFHHPRFSSGHHGPSGHVAPFWEALHTAGTELVLNGHDHDYERFAPQDPSGTEDRVRGIRQFVVGTGGVALRPFERVAANSELRAALAHGVLALTLRDGSYDWRFHAVGDAFSDRGTAFCH